MISTLPTRRGITLTVVICITFSALSIPFVFIGCGTARFRSSQDWSNVTDARLMKTCHVGNYGSGVVLSCDERGCYVLTCAHLVHPKKPMDVYVFSPQQGYKRYETEVVAHGDKQASDLALLRLLDPPSVSPWRYFTLQLASDLGKGEHRSATIMNIGLGAEKRPWIFTARVFEYVSNTTGLIETTPDGKRRQVVRGCMHGGITSANSGSPIFDGQDLLGLASASPEMGPEKDADGTLVLYKGIEVSTPSTIRAFLTTAGFEWILHQMDARLTTSEEHNGETRTEGNHDVSSK